MMRIFFVLLLVVVSCAMADTKLDIDDEKVKEFADKVAYAINKRSPAQFHYKLVKISKAEKWDVADNVPAFEIVFTIGETTCKKQEVTYEEAKQCDIKEGKGAYQECFAIYSPKSVYGDTYINFDCEHQRTI